MLLSVVVGVALGGGGNATLGGGVALGGGGGEAFGGSVALERTRGSSGPLVLSGAMSSGVVGGEKMLF